MPPDRSFDTLVAESGLRRVEALALLKAASGRSREWLYAHGDENAEPAVSAGFDALCERRRQGEPVAYLVGRREFFGHDLAVAPGVLIPRPETEALVEWACELASADGSVADLGTGSGAIAIALALERPDLKIWASDLSESALDIARRNATALGVSIHAWCRGNWYEAFGDASPRFDLLVSNPPYVAENDPHLARGDLRYEPALALVSGPDGLAAMRILIDGALQRLRPGGWLLLEHGFDQGVAVRALLEQAGFSEVCTRRDLAGHERHTGGQRPGP